MPGSTRERPTLVRIRAPLQDDIILSLRAGDPVWVDGVVYVARDAAHKRMLEVLQSGQPLPFDPRRQIIYYMGPSPTRPGKPIGSAGPTTSGRMDAYTPALIARMSAAPDTVFRPSSATCANANTYNTCPARNDTSPIRNARF